MLSMRGVTKYYGSIKVLDGVDFDVEDGEVHALLGSNGAGKSTLIKILGGLVPATEGDIRSNGQPIDVSSPRRSLEAGIAIVHQENDLVPELSVAENIFLGLEGAGGKRRRRSIFQAIDRASLKISAQKLLSRYGLDVDPDARVADLAPSAQQVVQIARVLALDSKVVVFDEPTARLGPRDRDRLFQIFAKLKAEGRRLVFVTHYLDEVMLAADRATIMRDGRLVDTLDVGETTVQEISRLMVGDDVAVPVRRKALTGATVLSVQSASMDDVYKDISLEIAGGEIVALLGHLGSGRHEFSRFVAKGHKSASNGRATGFVPEDRRSEGIFPQLTLYENIGVGMLQKKGLFSIIPKKRMVDSTNDYIRRLQIKTYGSQQVISTLSGGNQQKAVFARALSTDPDLYVIGCPTVGVDVKAGAELHAAIFGLAERGAAILLATDDLDEAIRLSDRIVVMRKGRISREFLPTDFSRQALVLAMGAG
jgi:ABC-type sugar transport system ATPase subunit